MIRRVETGGTKVSFWTITRALRRRHHHCLRRRYRTRRQAGYQAVRSQNLSRGRAKSAPAGARRMQSRERRGSTIRSRYRQSARPDWRRPHRLHRRSARRSLPDREAVYCGTGGCDLYILVTYPSGGTRLVFGQHVREYEVLPGAHYSLRVARRLLRWPGQSIVRQNAPHHRATVQVRDAAITIAFAGACRRFGYA